MPVKILTGMLCGSAAGSLLLLAAATLDPQEPRPPKKVRGVEATASDEKVFRGTVEELWVAKLGHVQFLLRGRTPEGEQFRLWFDTPPDQDVNTLFENLALSVIRHARENDRELQVLAESSSGDDGSGPEKAFDVVRLGISFGN